MGVFLLLGLGCAPRVAPVPATIEPQHVMASDVDPQRAMLLLEQIEPIPLAPPTSTPPAALSKRAAAQLAAAAPMLAEHRYAEAAQELEKALRYDPQHPVPHRMLALVAWGGGNLESVRTHAGRAIELDPNDVTAYYLLGRAAAGDGRVEEAMRQFRLALLSKPIEPAPAYVALTHYHLAGLLDAGGYLSAALNEYRAYERVVRELPAEQVEKSPDLATLAAGNGGRASEPVSVIYEKLGRFDDAASALAESMAHRAPDAAVRARYARLLSRAGRYVEALAEARQIQGDDRLTVELLLEIHERVNRSEAAIDDLRALLTAQPDRAVLASALVDALVKSGRSSDAERVLAEFLERNPRQLDLRWKQFDLAVAQSHWRAAFDALSTALGGAPDRFSDAQQRIAQLAQHPEAVDLLLGQADKLTAVLGVGAADSQGVAAHYVVGVLAVRAGAPQTGERHLREAMQQNPQWLAPRLALGEWYLEQYRWDDAIRTVAPSDVTLSPHNRPEWILGQAHAGLDQFEEAAQHFNQAISLNRADVDSMYQLARLYQNTGKALRAQRQYESILEAEPLHEASREALVGVYLAADRAADAAEQLEKLKAHAAAPTRIARCAALLQHHTRQTDLADFRRTLEEGMRVGRRDAETLTLLASAYQQENDLVAARAALAEAMQLDAPFEPAIDLAASIEALLLDFDRAEALRRELLRRHPQRTAWYQELSEILLNKQDFVSSLAVADAQLAREGLSERDRASFQAVALIALRGLKRDDEMAARLRAWLETTPDHEVYQRELLAALVRSGRKSDAVAQAQQWYERAAGDVKARWLLLTALSTTEQFTRAHQYLLEWLGQDPQNSNYLAALAENLSSAKRYDDALEVIRSVQESQRPPGADLRGPGLAELPSRLVELQILQSADRHGAAADLLVDVLRGVEQAGARGEALGYKSFLQQQLALALIRSERYEQAAAKLTRWLAEAREPEKVEERFDYLTALRYLHERRGQVQQSIEVMEMARQLRPDNEGINNDLGYTYADRGIKLEEAEKMIRFAVSRRPRQAAYLDSLGWVLYKKGDAAGAVLWLQRAATADEATTGGDPVITDHLADAQWRLGHKDEAVRLWHKAWELLQKEGGDESDEDRARAGLRQAVPQKLAAVERSEEPSVAPLAQSGQPQ
jgi:predicted Zn-dependent protease